MSLFSSNEKFSLFNFCSFLLFTYLYTISLPVPSNFFAIWAIHSIATHASHRRSLGSSQCCREGYIYFNFTLSPCILSSSNNSNSNFLLTIHFCLLFYPSTANLWALAPGKALVKIRLYIDMAAYPCRLSWHIQWCKIRCSIQFWMTAYHIFWISLITLNTANI